MHMLPIAPCQAYDSCTVQVKGGHGVFGSVVHCYGCRVECMQALSHMFDMGVLQGAGGGI